MNCPNCAAERLLTTETFQLPDKTYRTKKCRVCNWTFTSIEEISDELVIPIAVRKVKHRPGYFEEHNQRRREARSKK